MKKKFLLAEGSGVLFLLLLVMVKTVDVEAIGPNGTVVGLSGINRTVHDCIGVHMIWYHVTDWLGIAAIIVTGIFAVFGLVQFIKRKSFFKVDSEILVLGGLYLLTIGLYVLFELIVINYRPIIMPGVALPEASFPSSHTLMVCVIMGSAMTLLGKYVTNRKLQAGFRVTCILLIAITVIGRIISGVHWLTDVAAGVLLSVSLVSLYSGVLEKIQRCRKGA